MQRTPLVEIDGNGRLNTESNSFERGLIFGAAALGHGPTEIGEYLNVPTNTVKTTLQRRSNLDNGVSKPRSGRPNKVSERDKRRIIRIARSDPKITYAQLALEARVQCSRNTLYRTLEEYGLTNWVAKKRPLLSHSEEIGLVFNPRRMDGGGVV